VRPGAGESAELRWHTASEFGGAHVGEEVRESGRRAIALAAGT
jgi:hypothetical protein